MANLIYINVNIPDVSLSFKMPAWGYSETHQAVAAGDHWRYEYAFSSNGTFTVPQFVGDYEFVGWFAADYRESSNDLPVADYHKEISASLSLAGSVIVARTPYLNSAGGGSEKVARDCCLKYLGRRVAVLLNATGGTVENFLVVTRYGEDYGELPVPSRTGHTFVGWYTEIDGGELVTADTVVTISADHTLYARWARNPVMMTVYLIPCGGTVDPSSVTVTSGEVYGELPVPIRDGFNFKGWYTASLGGEAVAAETVVGKTYAHWLYAQWKKKTGGGSAGMFEIT